MRPGLLIILSILVVIYVPFTLWTVRRLWRDSVGSYRRMVYHFGVRRFGVGAWVVMTAVMLGRDSISGASIWIRAPILALINLPIWLWCGYVWGRAMAGVYGLRESD